jgi:hypothetical protein
MSEQFAEQLSRFTPEGGGLDRAAMLFEAGRASARPNRRWIALAAGLAACQLVTLALLWPPSGPRGDAMIARTPAPTVPESMPNPAPDASLYVLRDRAVATDGNLPRPESIDNLVPAEAPLRAFAVSLDNASD